MPASWQHVRSAVVESNAIIYELHVKAFNDGNADGIGDFQGLLQKLDYLQSLRRSPVSGFCRSFRRLCAMTGTTSPTT